MRSTIDLLRERRKKLWNQVPEDLRTELEMIDRMLEMESPAPEKPVRKKQDYEFKHPTLGQIWINPQNPKWETKYRKMVEDVYKAIEARPGKKLKQLEPITGGGSGMISAVVRWLEYDGRIQAQDPAQRMQSKVKNRTFEVVPEKESVLEGEEILDEESQRKDKTGIPHGYKYPDTVRRERLLEEAVNSFPDGINTADLYEIIKDDLNITSRAMLENLKRLRVQKRIGWESPTQRGRQTVWLPVKKAKKREVVLRPGETPREGRLKD